MSGLTVLGGMAAEYIGEKILDKFSANVIQRWTKKRAESFFLAFCEEVAKEEMSSQENINIDMLLDEILESDHRTEVMFDAYRHVCMARSKELGPRIIGLLTAQLIAKSRHANDSDELVFMAAEQLSDRELLDFLSFWEKNEHGTVDEFGEMAIEWDKVNIDSNWSTSKKDVSIGPMDLGEIGDWAPKLKLLNILHDDIKESQWEYDEDSERHIDEPGTMREISWWLYISSAGKELKELILRAKRA